MNREQRRRFKRKLKEKADRLWELESTFAKDASDTDTFQEMIQLASSFTPEEMLLVDEYLTELHGNAVWFFENFLV